MPANILEEHGLFWWSDEKVPNRQFAPDSPVPGALRVSEEGRIELEFDGFCRTNTVPGRSSPNRVRHYLRTEIDYAA